MSEKIEKEELNFNVSARTARLIGRENVASSEGAIIELVKNTYDADSDFCIIYFEIPYQRAPNELTYNEFVGVKNDLKRYNINLENYYIKQNNTWLKISFTPLSDLSEEENEKRKRDFDQNLREIDSLFNALTNIYIIDNGHGMDNEVIRKHWMTIGTNDKVDNFISIKKRTKSGAKGIGRFALDRLGEVCELWTKTNNASIKWSVDWETFEQQNKVINDIKALIEYGEFELIEQVNSLLSEQQSQVLIKALLSRVNPTDILSDFNHGTIIKVSYIRDDWDEYSLSKLRDSLETLVPPTEDSTFQIFLFNNRFPTFNGQLCPNICDNYDYKLVAKIINDDINISLIRNEFDIDNIPSICINKYFSGELKREVNITRKLGKMLPGSSDNKDINLSLIGDFTFSLYFLKKASSSREKKKYYQKTFDNNERNAWLKNNSGIKIFRDYFRVRPYGEIESTSWDWLGLGSRVALNPAAVSRKGQWKVSPANIAGIINISRVSNSLLVDKSNREGLQENDTFNHFKELILSLIKFFEDDRSEIYSKLDKYFKDNQIIPEKEDLSKKDEQKAHDIAQQKFKEYKEKQKTTGKSDKSNEELLSLTLLKEQAEKEDLVRDLVDMQEENALLRVFASSGVTIAAFAHELRNLEMKLGGNRYQFIKKSLAEYIDPLSFSVNDEFDNPYYILELIERDDSKMKNWLQYTLRTIKKDKRTRKSLNLINYFKELKKNWSVTLEDRQILFNVSSNEDSYYIKAFEIDFDCIFNNLIINSCEAFSRSNYINDKCHRIINIDINNSSSGLIIHYSDEGPGLSKDITNPDDIFIPAFSTKVDKSGKQVGTGLGMWLIKKTLDEYKGKIKIINKDNGFNLQIELPIFDQ